VDSGSEHADDSRWALVERLFHGALERTGAERERWLTEQARSDERLREEVEALLRSHERAAQGGLAKLAPHLGELTLPRRAAYLEPARRVGAYEILGIERVGGMGTVYRAWQQRPRREVALKVLDVVAPSARLSRRFESEAEILAHLSHPGIAQVLESGTLEQGGEVYPWFAMELVAGGRAVTDYAEEEGLDLRSRVELVIEVLDAVHHGHRRGVIHRDLKPQNILVDRKGRAKVIDFGVAKITEGDLLRAAAKTLAGQLVGTPAYMSPEQATGDGTAIDVRSDVFALGVVLFELVTGRRPYEVEGRPILEALQAVREVPPDRAALRSLPVDLAAILRKALRKDCELRYDSCAAFAEDLRRFLRREPVLARDPSTFYHVTRWVGRNRALSVALLAVLLSVIAGVATTGTALWREREQSREAERRKQEAEAARADAVLALGEAEWGREFLAGLFYGIDPYGGRETVRSLEELVVDAVERLEVNPPPRSSEATTRAALGNVLANLGRHHLAERQLRRALELRLEEGSEELVLPLEVRLANVLFQLGKLAEADLLAREAVELGTRLEGESGSETLRARNLVGLVLGAWGHSREALEYFEAELAELEDVLAPGHPRLLTAQVNLGICLGEAARYDEAIEVLEEAARRREEQLGPDAPETLSARSALATVIGLAGDPERAALLLEDVLERRREVLGPVYGPDLRYGAFPGDDTRPFVLPWDEGAVSG